MKNEAGQNRSCRQQVAAGNDPSIFIDLPAGPPATAVAAGGWDRGLGMGQWQKSTMEATVGGRLLLLDFKPVGDGDGMSENV